MTTEARIGENEEFGWFFAAVVLVGGIAGLVFMLTRPGSPPAPSNRAVYGCYAAPNSPAILLDAAGMHVRQAGYPVVPFHLERLKTGTALTADRPIRADRTNEGYRFGMDKRGIGIFMPFYRVENRHSYGVFDDSLLQTFQLLASDREYLNYGPTDASRCAGAS